MKLHLLKSLRRRCMMGKKNNVEEGVIAPLKLLPTLSAPAGVGSAPGNKFQKRRAKNKDATNHTSHCSRAVRLAAPRKG